MPEIIEQMNMVDSTPIEAAQNIENSSIFNIGADVFKDFKSDFQPTVDQLSRPKEATASVTDYISRSKEHAALAVPDVQKLSQAEVKIKNISDNINGIDLEKQVSDLERKQEVSPDNFTQDDFVKLMTLKDDLSESRKFKTETPGKNDEVINKVLDTSKDIGTINAFTTSLKKGLSGFYADVGKAPSLLYDMYFYPANLIRQARGEELTTAPESLTDNPMVQRYNEASEFFQSQVPELNKSISEAVASGNFGEAGKIAALQLTANAPNQIALLLAGATGVGAAGLVGAGVTTAARSNYENQKKGINVIQSLPNAIGKGTIEASFESLGTLGAFKSWESALRRTYGSESAKKIVSNTMKSIVYSGAAEGNEEALTTVAQNLTDYVTGVNPDAFKNIGFDIVDSFLLGAASGTALTAPAAITSGAIKARSDIIETKQVKNATVKAIDALQLDSDLTSVVETLKQTEMNNIAPAQVGEVVKSALAKVGLDKLWFDKEDLNKWANSKEKAEAVMNMIDPSGKTAAAINASLDVEAHKFMEVALQYPDITSIVKKSPQEINAEKAKSWLTNLEQSQTMREQILRKLGSTTINEQERQELEAELQGVKLEYDIAGEQEYLDQTELRKAAEIFMPPGELDRLLQAETDAKMQVVDNINETAQYEMDQVKDVVVEAGMEAQREEETLKIQNDPNLDVVDRFTKGNKFFATERFKELSDMTITHAKEGYSPFAIDPRTLTEKQRETYLKDKQLRKHKVFVKGGMNANESAKLLGVNGGENLLKVLSRTPTRKEVIDRETELRRKKVQDEADRSVDLNNTAIAKAYSARLANALTTLKYMKDKEWPALKGAIKRIALKPPSIAEIVAEAKTYVLTTKVGRLNVNQFKVGERKSQRLAVEAVLRNEPEEAYKNQKAVASNIALANETQMAIARVNRVIQFAKRFNKADIIQELKDAGPQYYNAAIEILDVFNLNPRYKGQSERDSFVKWAKEMMETGEGDFQIPERLSDLRGSINEMTVDDVIVVGAKLRNILYKAKFKNKLYNKHETMKVVKTIQGYAHALRAQAQTILSYDLTKNDQKVQSAVNPIQAFYDSTIYEGQNYLERPQYIISKLDKGKVTGLYNDLFYRPFVEADAAAKKLTAETRDHFVKIIKQFGEKDFDNLSSEFVDIPEFTKVKEFKNGRVSKMELLMMELNFGNEGNISALERYGVNRDELRQVLDRELQAKHTEFAQNIWNMFDTFKPKIQELQLKTDGSEVNWVQSKPFEARGKQYPGGYYPIHLAVSKKNIKRKNLQGTAETNKLANATKYYYAQTVTDQGHLEQRTGSSDPLALDMHRLSQSLSQIIHDLTHREVIRDTTKLLADEMISEDIVAVVGIPGYRTMADMVIHIAEGLETKGYEADNFAAGFLRQLGGGVQTVAIALKFTSLAIQPVSLLTATNRMGNIQGAKYISRAAYKIMTNPRLIGEYLNFAEMIHPPLRASREDTEGQADFVFSEFIPSRKYPIISPILAGRDFINEWAFGALAWVDRGNKTIVAIAAYEQAFEGNAPGVPKGDVEAATKYASNLIELTQTSNEVRNLSPIQKNRWIKWATYFYSDLNNLYNNTLHVAREARIRFQETGLTKDEIDWKRASKAAAEGINGIAGVMLIFSLAKMYESIIRGQPTPFDEDEEGEDGFLARVAKWFLTSPMEFLDTMPLVRDVKFAASKHWEKRKVVDMPIDSALGSLATAFVGLGHALDFDREATAKEKKEMLITFGIITKIPTGALYNYVIKPDFENTPKVNNEISKVTNSITNYLKENVGKIPDAMKEELEKFKQDINAQGPAVLPEDVSQVIKQVVSQGNPFKFNEVDGAVGVYQFTEEVWNNIREMAPDLGLTEGGRESDNPAQQEKAMTWITQRNAEMLRDSEAPVNNSSLLASHLIGPVATIEMYKASGDTKLKSFVNENFMKANDLKNSMKVRDFKQWLDTKTKEATDQLVPR